MEVVIQSPVHSWEGQQNLVELFNNTRMKVVMVGLSNAGKSTMLRTLQIGSISASAYRGFDVEVLRYKEVCCTVWDLNADSLQSQNFKDIDGLIFVVDSGNKEGINSAGVEFKIIIDDPLFCQIPILIMANKHDLKDALPLGEVCKSLGLYKFRKNTWHVQHCSAIKGEGIYDGFEWLITALGERAPQRSQVLEVVEVAQHRDGASLILDADLVNMKHKIGCKASLAVDTGFTGTILLSERKAQDLKLEPEKIYNREHVDAGGHKHHGIGFGMLRCDFLSPEDDNKQPLKSKEVDIIAFWKQKDGGEESAKTSKSDDDWQRELLQDLGEDQPVLWVSPIKNGLDSRGEVCLFGLKAMDSLSLGIHPNTHRLIIGSSSCAT